MKVKINGLLTLAVMFVALTACECSFSTAGIRDATLCKSVTDKTEPVNPTTTFATDDKVIHCVVTLGSAPDGTKVRARWSVVKVAGEDPNKKVAETDISTKSGQNVIDFTLTAAGAGLPQGDYKVDLFLNPKTTEEGPPDKTVNFSVK